MCECVCSYRVYLFIERKLQEGKVYWNLVPSLQCNELKNAFSVKIFWNLLKQRKLKLLLISCVFSEIMSGGSEADSQGRDSKADYVGSSLSVELSDEYFNELILKCIAVSSLPNCLLPIQYNVKLICLIDCEGITS